jgi:hypothetical protein
MKPVFSFGTLYLFTELHDLTTQEQPVWIFTA